MLRPAVVGSVDWVANRSGSARAKLRQDSAKREGRTFIEKEAFSHSNSRLSMTWGHHIVHNCLQLNESCMQFMQLTSV